ncbi:MAG: hypothetical protein ACQEWV_18670 [Bacillota bacterium]
MFIEGKISGQEKDTYVVTLDDDKLEVISLVYVDREIAQGQSATLDVKHKFYKVSDIVSYEFKYNNPNLVSDGLEVHSIVIKMINGDLIEISPLENDNCKDTDFNDLIRKTGANGLKNDGLAGSNTFE